MSNLEKKSRPQLATVIADLGIMDKDLADTLAKSASRKAMKAIITSHKNADRRDNGKALFHVNKTGCKYSFVSKGSSHNAVLNRVSKAYANGNASVSLACKNHVTAVKRQLHLKTDGFVSFDEGLLTLRSKVTDQTVELDYRYPNFAVRFTG